MTSSSTSKPSGTLKDSYFSGAPSGAFGLSPSFGSVFVSGVFVSEGVVVGLDSGVPSFSKDTDSLGLCSVAGFSLGVDAGTDAGGDVVCVVAFIGFSHHLDVFVWAKADDLEEFLQGKVLFPTVEGHL